MLDWIKRIKTPPASVPLVESENPNPASGGERLERLLIRLGTERSGDEAVIEIAGPAGDSGGAAPSAAEIGGSPDIVSNLATDTVALTDSPDLASEPGEVAAPAASAEAAPEIDSTLAAEISAAIDSLDGSGVNTAGLSAEASLGTDGEAEADETEADSGFETGAILGADTVEPDPGIATAEPVAARSPVTIRHAAVPIAPGLGRMRVIAVCSQKGGSGKTTIAGHLAVQAGLAGNGPVVLVDTDPQGSLAEWWRARKSDAPALAKVRLEELDSNLAELRSYGTAITIIDTPPALTGSIEQVMAIADLVVIPARPSPHDLRAVGATVEMARRAGKPFLFVLNGAAQRANITVQAVAALSEHGRVSPVILYQRTEFAASMIDGRTVIEAAPSGRSAQEIADLWKFVEAQINMRAAA